MLIQCITSVKIHCITCITLNYCLTETLPLGYRLYIRELDRQHSCMSEDLYLQFPLSSVCFFNSGYKHAT